MAALPPEIQQQPDPQQHQPVDPQVDPNSPPPDPMLAFPGGDQQQGQGYPTVPEVEYREEVEMCVLQTIDVLAKSCRVGEGASNMDWAMKAGQAGAAWGQCYAALSQAEQAEAKAESTNPSQSA